MGVEAWSTTAASNNASPPNGAPEGMAASAVNDCIRQVMADVRSQLQDGQWLNWGHTPTRVDNDTFTVATDLTAIYEAGRRLKVTGSATGYCTIASSSYSAPNTTVNVTMDSGNLPGTLSAVYVALLSGSSISVPLLSASILTSGSLADARLSSNVPLKNAANTFTATQAINPASGAGMSISGPSAASGYMNFVDGNTGTRSYALGSGVVGTGYFALYDNTAGALRWYTPPTGGLVINAPGSGIALTVNGSGQTIRVTDGTVQVDTYVGSGNGYIGTNTAHPAHLMSTGIERLTAGASGGITITASGSAPTGGNKGDGTLNTAGAIYQNNVAVALAPLVSVGSALNISTIAVGQSAYVYKTASTARTSNATAALDPVLQFTNAPAGTYLTEGALTWTQADTTADFRIGWPRGVDYSGTIHVIGIDNTATKTESSIAFLSAETEIENSSGGASTQGATIRGTEVATAGQTLGPTWAQFTSNANATTVTGGWLKVTRLS